MKFPLVASLGIMALCGAALSRAASEFTVRGNGFVSGRKIEAAAAFPERPQTLSGADWGDWAEDATQAVLDLYRASGFFDAAVRVETPAAQGGRGTDGSWARVDIREGIRYRIGSVTLITEDGSPPLPDSGDLRCRPGRWFDRELMFKDRREIVNRYGDAGFLHCRSAESSDPDTVAKTVNLRFDIDRGYAAVFDTLILRDVREDEGENAGSPGRGGAPGITNADLLRSILKLGKGDTLSLGVVERFEKKLKSTRAFNQVRVKDSLLADNAGRSALILAMEEKVPGETDFSAFYETQYGAGVSADWYHGNIAGRLHEGKLGAWLAQRKQSVYAGYASPLFFGTSLRFDNDVTANWYQDGKLQAEAGFFRGDFDVTNASKISRALTSWSRYVGSAELTGKSEKIDSVSRTRDFSLNFLNSVYLSFLDDGVNPSRGARWSLTWGNGGSFLSDGQINVPLSTRHNWLEGESAYYLPLLERLKLAFRLDGGRFFGAGGINAERFYLGGPRNVRSFGWRKVCPEQDSSSGVCLTDGIEPAYVLTSFEIRLTPFSQSLVNPDGAWKHLLALQVVPFTDYGNVWEVGKNLRPEGQGKAYGLGLRYSLLSIFNVRLDYAVDGWKRNHSQWMLDLAQAF